MTEVKSEIKEEPLFSLKNFLRPTSANVNIWGNAIKTGCISLIAFATTLIVTSPNVAISIIVLAIIVGGIAESLIFFTREKTVETLQQAIVDLKEEKMEDLTKVDTHVE